VKVSAFSRSGSKRKVQPGRGTKEALKADTVFFQGALPPTGLQKLRRWQLKSHSAREGPPPLSREEMWLRWWKGYGSPTLGRIELEVSLALSNRTVQRERFGFSLPVRVVPVRESSSGIGELNDVVQDVVHRTTMSKWSGETHRCECPHLEQNSQPPRCVRMTAVYRSSAIPIGC